MGDASELIANALERNGMTRKELVAALGIGEAEIVGYLAGDRDMTVRQLAKSLHVLGRRLELRFPSVGFPENVDMAPTTGVDSEWHLSSMVSLCQCQ